MNRSSKKKKYYAVAKGFTPGVYETWPEAEAQVRGFPKSLHKAFETREEAAQFVEAHKEAFSSQPPPRKRRHAPAASTIPDFDTDPDDLAAYDSPFYVTPAGSQRQQRAAEPTLFMPRDLGELTESEAAGLDPEQRAVVAECKHGNSVFFSGSAGSGKSFVLRRIVQVLGANGVRVAVTATTGIAAMNIGGQTLHSWSGVGRCDTPHALGKAFGRKKAWLRTQVLIVDEVSMLSALLFHRLERIARDIRGRVEGDTSCANKPFGGLQLVFVGDFFQLPPVEKRKPEKSGNARFDEEAAFYFDKPFCFMAKNWRACFPRTFMLSRVYRQTDEAFKRILDEIRGGQISFESLTLLNTRVVTPESEPPEGCSMLFARNKAVDALNTARLGRIESASVEYRANLYAEVSHGNDRREADMIRMLRDGVLAPETLVLKKGALVMLLANLDSTRVNGTQGIVVDFREPTVAEAKEAAEKTKLRGWTITNRKELPVVKWHGHELSELVFPYTFTVEKRMDKAVMEQLPLKLAWAISIHKSQGQTLQNVQVEPRGVFESGQLYVALSRVTTLEGLRLSFPVDPKMVFQSQAVRLFYRFIEEEKDERCKPKEEEEEEEPAAPAPAAPAAPAEKKEEKEPSFISFPEDEISLDESAAAEALRIAEEELEALRKTAETEAEAEKEEEEAIIKAEEDALRKAEELFQRSQPNSSGGGSGGESEEGGDHGNR